jgi:hypothetical protein
VTIDVRRHSRTIRRLDTRVTPSCAIRAVALLKVRRGTRLRVAARFDGNSLLQARRARSVVLRAR